MASSKQFKASIVLGGTVANSLKAAFSSTESSLSRLGDNIKKLQQRQTLLGTSIQVFGRMGKNVDGVRERYMAVTAQVNRLREAQERLNTAAKNYKTINGIAGKVAGAGVVLGAAGAALAMPLRASVQESVKYQTEQARVRSLGLGDRVSNQAIAYAAQMKTFGTSQLDNLQLMRDALSVFGDFKDARNAMPTLAKMKFGNAAMFGSEQGGENEQKFMDMLKVIELRGGTNSKGAFNDQANMVQRVISATGGRVGPDEWRNLIATGGIAAKGMRDDAFYYQLEHLVQEQGGDRVGTGLSSAYSSLYQGRTTKRALQNLEKYGLIGDKSKTTPDKVGQIAHINPGALLGSEQFRQSQFEWVKNVLLPTLAKHGVTSKDQIEDAIGSIVSNKKGGDLLTTMYLQQRQIEKDEKLSRGAYGVDQINDQGKQTAEGRLLQAHTRLDNVERRIGDQLLPIYTKGLNLAAGAMERISAWADKHPKMFKAIVIGVGAVSASFLALAPILISVGGMLSAYAGYTLLMAKFGAAAAEGSAGVGLLSKSLTMTGGILRWVGTTLLSSPIFWAAAAIGVAAYEIYKHWDGVKAFFSTLWADLKDIFSAEIDVITSLMRGDFSGAVTAVKHVFSGMGKFVQDVFDGIASGIATVLQDALTAMGLIDQKQRELDVGKQNAKKEEDFRNASLGAAAKMLLKGGPSALPAIWGMYQANRNLAAQDDASVNAVKWNTGSDDDVQPPTSGTIVHQSNVFHITQQPGEDGEALAQRTAAMLQQQQSTQSRGQLIDGISN